MILAATAFLLAAQAPQPAPTRVAQRVAHFQVGMTILPHRSGAAAPAQQAAKLSPARGTPSPGPSTLFVGYR